MQAFEELVQGSLTEAVEKTKDGNFESTLETAESSFGWVLPSGEYLPFTYGAETHLTAFKDWYKDEYAQTPEAKRLVAGMSFSAMYPGRKIVSREEWTDTGLPEEDWDNYIEGNPQFWGEQWLKDHGWLRLRGRTGWMSYGRPTRQQFRKVQEIYSRYSESPNELVYAEALINDTWIGGNVTIQELLTAKGPMSLLRRRIKRESSESMLETARFVGRCDELPGSDIEYMVDNATDISNRTFRRLIGNEEYRRLENYPGYDRYLRMADDDLVSYGYSTFQGQPAVYADQSAIEHVFVLDRPARVRGMRQASFESMIEARQKRPPLDYLSIGHRTKARNPWIVLRDEDNVRYGPSGSTHYQWYKDEFGGDPGNRVDALGRVDHTQKRISFFPLAAGRERMKYIVSVLKMDYPDYEVWHATYRPSEPTRFESMVEAEPAQSSGWLLPDGTFVPILSGQSHAVQARRWIEQNVPERELGPVDEVAALDYADREGWIRFADSHNFELPWASDRLFARAQEYSLRLGALRRREPFYIDVDDPGVLGVNSYVVSYEDFLVANSISDLGKPMRTGGTASWRVAAESFESIVEATDTEQDRDADQMLAQYQAEPTNLWLYTDMPVKDRVAWAYLAADEFKDAPGEEDMLERFVAALKEVVQDPETFWKQIEEKDKTRAEYLSGAEWTIEEVPLTDVGVYPKFSGYPDEACKGDVVETAEWLRHTSEQPLKRKKLLTMADRWMTILHFLPPILVPGGTIRGRHEDYKQTKYDIDDGNHRAVAAALDGAESIIAFVGKPKGAEEKKESLTEDFETYLKAMFDPGKYEIPVFRNPTAKEVSRDLQRGEQGYFRALVTADGTVYAWPGDADMVHTAAARKLRLHNPLPVDVQAVHRYVQISDSADVMGWGDNRWDEAEHLIRRSHFLELWPEISYFGGGMTFRIKAGEEPPPPIAVSLEPKSFESMVEATEQTPTNEVETWRRGMVNALQESGTDLQANAEELLGEPVDGVWIMGSVLDPQRFTEQSDIDIAVRVTRPDEPASQKQSDVLAGNLYCYGSALDVALHVNQDPEGMRITGSEDQPFESMVEGTLLEGRATDAQIISLIKLAKKADIAMGDEEKPEDYYDSLYTDPEKGAVTLRNWIEQCDPHPRNAFGSWLAREWKKQLQHEIKTGDAQSNPAFPALESDGNRSTIRTQLSKFMKAKARKLLKGKQGDINSYSYESFAEAMREIDEFALVTKKETAQGREAIEEVGGNVVYEKGHWLIVAASSPDDLMELTKGSGWCVKNEEYAKAYLARGEPVYVMFSRKRLKPYKQSPFPGYLFASAFTFSAPRAASSYEGFEWEDALDTPVDEEWVEENDPGGALLAEVKRIGGFDADNVDPYLDGKTMEPEWYDEEEEEPDPYENDELAATITEAHFDEVEDRWSEILRARASEFEAGIPSEDLHSFRTAVKKIAGTDEDFADQEFFEHHAQVEFERGTDGDWYATSDWENMVNTIDMESLWFAGDPEGYRVFEERRKAAKEFDVTQQLRLFKQAGEFRPGDPVRVAGPGGWRYGKIASDPANREKTSTYDDPGAARGPTFIWVEYDDGQFGWAAIKDTEPAYQTVAGAPELESLRSFELMVEAVSIQPQPGMTYTPVEFSTKHQWVTEEMIRDVMTKYGIMAIQIDDIPREPSKHVPKELHQLVRKFKQLKGEDDDGERWHVKALVPDEPEDLLWEIQDVIDESFGLTGWSVSPRGWADWAPKELVGEEPQHTGGNFESMIEATLTEAPQPEQIASLAKLLKKHYRELGARTRWRDASHEELVQYVKEIGKNADPQPNWEHGRWLLKQWKNHLKTKGAAGLDLEDEGLRTRTHNALVRFVRAKTANALTGDAADINKYKTPEELQTVLAALPEEAFVSKRALKRGKLEDRFNFPGSEVVAEDKRVKVVKITSAEAAHVHADHTDWCTADTRAAERYLEAGPLYVVYEETPKGWTQVFQTTFDGSEAMSPEGESLDGWWIEFAMQRTGQKELVTAPEVTQVLKNALADEQADFEELLSAMEQQESLAAEFSGDIEDGNIRLDQLDSAGSRDPLVYGNAKAFLEEFPRVSAEAGGGWRRSGRPEVIIPVENIYGWGEDTDKLLQAMREIKAGTWQPGIEAASEIMSELEDQALSSYYAREIGAAVPAKIDEWLEEGEITEQQHEDLMQGWEHDEPYWELTQDLLGKAYEDGQKWEFDIEEGAWFSEEPEQMLDRLTPEDLGKHLGIWKEYTGLEPEPEGQQVMLPQESAPSCTKTHQNGAPTFESMVEVAGTIGWFNPETTQDLRAKSSRPEDDHFAMVAENQELFGVDLQDTRGWRDTLDKVIANGWVRVNYYAGDLLLEAPTEEAARKTALFYREDYPYNYVVLDVGKRSTTVGPETLDTWLAGADLFVGIPSESFESMVEAAESETHDYACIMARIPDVQATLEAMREFIDAEDIYEDEDPGEPHVTVLYGLQDSQLDEIKKKLEKAKPFALKVKDFELFEPEEEDYDVIVLRVESPELVELHDELAKLPHESTHPDYKPHLTLAYVKKGKGKRYTNAETSPFWTYLSATGKKNKPSIIGRQTTVDTAIISKQSGGEEDVELSSGLPEKLAKAVAQAIAKINEGHEKDEQYAAAVYINHETGAAWVEHGDWENEDNGYAPLEELHKAIRAIPGIKSVDGESEAPPPQSEAPWEQVEWREKRKKQESVSSFANLVERRRAPQTTVFHGTSSEFLPKIMSQGLIPIEDPEKKPWGYDPSATFTSVSRASIGGTYLTDNLMTASSAAGRAVRKFGGQEVIVAAQVSLGSAYADEDDLTYWLRAAIPGREDSELNIAELYIQEALFPESTDSRRLKMEFKEAFLNSMKGRVGELWDPELEGRLRQLLEDYYRVVLARFAAYVDDRTFKRAVSYDARASEQYDWETALELRPGREQAETDWRAMLDQLTRTLGLLGVPKSYALTMRMMEPVGFTGRNRIVAIYREERGITSEFSTDFVRLYGETDPPGMIEQMQTKFGPSSRVYSPEQAEQIKQDKERFGPAMPEAESLPSFAGLVESDWTELGPAADEADPDALRDELEALYELEYKHSKIEANEWAGTEDKEQVLAGMEEALREIAESICEKLSGVFGEWLKKHALMDPKKWAANHVELYYEQGYDPREVLAFVAKDMDNGRWDMPDFETALKAHFEDMPVLQSFAQDLYDDAYESWEADEPDMEEENPYEDMDLKEFFFDYASDYSPDLGEFLKYYAAEIGEGLLFEVVEKAVHPYWAEYWRAQGIEQTREIIETAYEEMVIIAGGSEEWSIGELKARITYFVNITHQTGPILDYVNEHWDLSVGDLTALSERTTTDWDEELAEMGVREREAEPGMSPEMVHEIRMAQDPRYRAEQEIAQDMRRRIAQNLAMQRYGRGPQESLQEQFLNPENAGWILPDGSWLSTSGDRPHDYVALEWIRERVDPNFQSGEFLGTAMRHAENWAFEHRWVRQASSDSLEVPGNLEVTSAQLELIRELAGDLDENATVYVDVVEGGWLRVPAGVLASTEDLRALLRYKVEAKAPGPSITSRGNQVGPDGRDVWYVTFPGGAEWAYAVGPGWRSRIERLMKNQGQAVAFMKKHGITVDRQTLQPLEASPGVASESLTAGAQMAVDVCLSAGVPLDSVVETLTSA